MIFLFILEGLGTNELLLILIVALIIFGPRKLPQLSKSLGKSLADFKRASDDFKQTWEKEVARESTIKEMLTGEAMLPEDRSIMGESRDRSRAIIEETERTGADLPAHTANTPATDGPMLAPPSTDFSTDTPAPQPTRKRDWL